jgi:arginine-tRNA-protein transferase
VYTFFDPTLPAASLGTYNIVWQIAQCAANELPYLYLGYWIRDSRKMAYKVGFRPIEGLVDGRWRDLPVQPGR